MFPMNKYKFYEGNGRIVAVSTFAGKTVRGVAKCDPRDGFDREKGKNLAAARCALKIAKKRRALAQKRFAEAQTQELAAKKHFKQMTKYMLDSTNAMNEAQASLDALLTQM